MANIRMSRINGELQKAIAEIVANKLNNPEFDGLIISIVDVDTSSDLSIAKVAVSVLTNDTTKNMVVAQLNHAKNFIKREVMRVVRLRAIPDLVFYVDDSYEKGRNLLNLIEKVSSENKGE